MLEQGKLEEWEDDLPDDTGSLVSELSEWSDYAEEFED